MKFCAKVVKNEKSTKFRRMKVEKSLQITHHRKPLPVAGAKYQVAPHEEPRWATPTF